MSELELLKVRCYELIMMFSPDLIFYCNFDFEPEELDGHEIHNEISDASAFYLDVHKDDIFYDTPDTVKCIIKGLERHDEYELCGIMREVEIEITNSFNDHPELRDYYTPDE